MHGIIHKKRNSAGDLLDVSKTRWGGIEWKGRNLCRIINHREGPNACLMILSGKCSRAESVPEWTSNPMLSKGAVLSIWTTKIHVAPSVICSFPLKVIKSLSTSMGVVCAQFSETVHPMQGELSLRQVLSTSSPFNEPFSSSLLAFSLQHSS